MSITPEFVEKVLDDTTDALLRHDKRLHLLEQRLVDLAARCWPHCGSTFAPELAEEIKAAKESTDL